MSIKPWVKLSSSYPFKSDWFNIRSDRCANSSGEKIGEYFVIEEADWVHVVPFDSDGNILLIRQYRHGAAKVSLELPGGVIDSDETPEVAAQRELQEETGHSAARLVPLPVMAPNPARYSNMAHGFIGHDISKISEQKLDQDEEIEVEFYTQRQVRELINASEISHALHIGAILLAIELWNGRI